MMHKQLTKQMLDFNKAAFDNTFYAMSSLQDQLAKVINIFLDQSPWFPADGKKVVGEWVNAYKKCRDEFKTSVDGNYKKVEEFFDK